MEWRTQGLCPACGQRLPVGKPFHHGIVFEGHDKCNRHVFRRRKAPAEPFNRLYPLVCVGHFMGLAGGGILSSMVARSDIEHKTIKIGQREIKCITFEEILRRSADGIAKPVYKRLGPLISTSRNRVFRQIDDVERMCFLDSPKFRTIWIHQEKEKS